MSETDRKNCSPRRRRKQGNLENVCSYCLFFERAPDPRRRLSGNCTYHKEWIQHASLTTCSDMTEPPLKEKGIYQLDVTDRNQIIYTRRQEKVRTRLFLIKGKREVAVRTSGQKRQNGGIFKS